MSVTLALTIAVFAVGVDAYIVAAVLPAIADDLHKSIAAANGAAIDAETALARTRPMPLRHLPTRNRAQSAE